MFTGRSHAWQDASGCIPDFHSVLDRVGAGYRPDLAALRPDTPSTVVALIQRCWAQDPATRPTAVAIAQETGTWLAVRSIMRVVTPQTTPPEAHGSQTSTTGACSSTVPDNGKRPEDPDARTAMSNNTSGTQDLTNEQLDASLNGLNLGNAGLAPPATVGSRVLGIGSRVLGRWRNWSWNLCVVESVSATGLSSVAFPDGEKTRDVPVEVLKLPDGRSALISPPKSGDNVLVERCGIEWFPGCISGAADGLYEVTYDDGDVEVLSAEHVCLELSIGTRVLAQWLGHVWFPAEVVHSSDGVCAVVGNNLGVPEVVPLDAVRIPGSSATPMQPLAPETGTRVEVAIFGRAWFPGIVKARSGGNYVVVFDDDGTENVLSPTRVRPR